MFAKIENRLKQSLLKAEGFLKTDIRYIAKQGSWLAGGEVLNNILGLILIIAFGNLVPAATYGTYKYVLSIYGIFSLFGLSGSGPAIIKTVAEGNENIYSPAIKVQIKWALLGSLSLILIASYYFINNNFMLGYCFIIAALALPFFESLNTYQHILAGKKRFDLQITYYTGTRLVSALSLIAVIFFTKNVLAILAAYFLPYIIANLLFGSLALKKIELNDKFDPTSITYIKHLSFINIISFVVSYLDGIIIFHFLGPVQLAVYSIASAPASRVQSFFSIVPELSLPKYGERPVEEIREGLSKKVLKSIVICTLIVIAFVSVIPFFFKWFLPKYIGSIFYAQLLAIPLIWYPLSLFSRVLLAKGATKFMFRIGLLSSIPQLVIMLLAIYYYGLMGAIVGRIIVSGMTYPLVYYYFKKL